MYKNFNAECARRNVSNKKIAESTGVCENTVSLIKRGKGKVSIEFAFKVRHDFFPDLSLEYLFEITEPTEAIA